MRTLVVFVLRYTWTQECPRCGGSGYIGKYLCRECNGEGWITRSA